MGNTSYQGVKKAALLCKVVGDVLEQILVEPLRELLTHTLVHTAETHTDGVMVRHEWGGVRWGAYTHTCTHS